MRSPDAPIDVDAVIFASGEEVAAYVIKDVIPGMTVAWPRLARGSPTADVRRAPRGTRRNVL